MIFAPVFRALAERDVRYFVVGGVAVIAHGYLRATEDLDLVLDLSEGNLRRAMDAFHALGYRPVAPVDMFEFCDPAKRQEWRNRRMIAFRLHDPAQKLPKIDLFSTEPFDIEREDALASRLDLEGVTVPVVSASTLLLMKRAAGRDKDMLDIRFLEALQAKGSRDA